MAVANKYIDPTEVKHLLDDLHEIATEQRLPIFENIHESNVRKRLARLSGITPEMIDAAILAILNAGKIRNNRVVTLPSLNDDGILCCFLCGSIPVVKPTAVVPNADPEPGQEDLSFVTFICAEHADNPDATQKEIDSRNMIWRMAQQYKKVK